jgi:predicted PolB exonuclease-like 3'-5' exonuclease
MIIMKKSGIAKYIETQCLATETISFQSGNFGLELEEFVIDVRNKYNNVEDFVSSRVSTKISQIIKKHTNMLVNIDVDHQSVYVDPGPAIFLPSLSANHLFTENFIKPYVDKTTSESFIRSLDTNQGRNGVNLKTSKVFGVFEDIQTTMLLNASIVLHNLFTPKELAAAMLHEIGHLFTYFEYFSRTVTTNQVLSNLCEHLESEKDMGVRENMIQQAANAVNYKQELPKELLEETDSRKIAVKLMRYVYTSSETGSTKYDESNCETLADQFAARHQYALPLASALYKTSPESTAESKLGRAVAYAGETVSLFLKVTAASVYVGLAVAGSAPVAISVAAGVGAFGLLLLAGTFGDSSDNMWNRYDVFPTRLKKMREQLIQQTRLKNKKPSETAKVLSQISDIDELIKYSIDKDYLLRTIADFIRPSNKGTAANLVLNRRLEELASNNLFVSAAKLKTFA